MRLILLIVISIWLTSPSIALANGAGLGYSQNDKSKLRVKSSKQAAQIAKSRVGGKVLKVKKGKVNGNPAYRVRVLKKDGNIVPVVVDAKTGRVKGK